MLKLNEELDDVLNWFEFEDVWEDDDVVFVKFDVTKLLFEDDDEFKLMRFVSCDASSEGCCDICWLDDDCVCWCCIVCLKYS